MIKIQNLHKKLDNFQLKNINFEKEKGIITILGSSGSGKSTLLDIIAGFTKADEGKIYLYNQDITHLEPNLRNISYCPQNLYLFPHLTVKENILIPQKFGQNICSNLQELLEKFELKEHLEKNIFQLSQGQKQRVSLLRAIIPKTRLILLDEPSSSLQLSFKIKLWEIIKNIQKERNIPLIITTHDPTEAMYLSDHLIIIENGEIIDQGNPKELFFYPSSLKAVKYWGIKNIFKAKLEKIEDKQLLFSYNNTKIIINKNQTLKIKKIQTNKPYLIGFREELAQIVNNYPNTNLLEIQVTNSLFLGHQYLIEGKIKNTDKNVFLKVDSQKITSLSTNINVYIDPNNWFIIDY